LDLLAGIGIFFRKTVHISLLYCVVWGFLTAMARIVGYTHLGFEEVFIRWLPEMILRLPNSFIPLWVLLTFYNKKNYVA
jgi:phosphate starvation-inducible membrane PsiE